MWVCQYPQACGIIHSIHLHLICLSFYSRFSVLTFPINIWASDVSSKIKGQYCYKSLMFCQAFCFFFFFWGGEIGGKFTYIGKRHLFLQLFFSIFLAQAYGYFSEYYSYLKHFRNISKIKTPWTFKADCILPHIVLSI